MFHRLLALTLLLGGAMLACASYSEGELLSLRSAAELTGWLCVSAILLTVCALRGRSGGLRNIGRATFAELTAGATTLLTGALLLYVTYFEWSELPIPVVQIAASAPEVDRALASSLKFFPGATVTAPPLPAFQPAVTTKYAASAGSTARESLHARRAASDFVANAIASPYVVPSPYVDDPCSSLSGVASLQCQRCATEGGLSRIFCDERARLEYCADEQGADPGCPSAIPAAAPQ